MSRVERFENVTLYEGRCEDVLCDIDGGSIDCVLADPPYGTTACAWDSIIPLDEMWQLIERVVKERSPIVMTASQPFTSKLVSSRPDWFRYEWIWEKGRPSNFPQAKRQPMKYHENVVVFGRASPNYYPIMIASDKPRRKGKNDGYQGFNKGLGRPDYLEKVYTDFYPGSIQFFANHNGGMVHPTQKPVALMEYMIRTYTQPGETVLDFCCGSGTTGVAAVNTDRKAILIERDSTYFDIACKRIESALNEQPLLAGADR